jgi:methyltransferase (TIGR00027 family)
MQTGQPSRTAYIAALHRAAHQVVEQGRIFNDPLALRIAKVSVDDLIRADQLHPERRSMRIFIAVRTRIAEEALSAAVGRGVRQLVILGAGLDTFAYRQSGNLNLRVFEVDHPATQLWKKQCLADAGITIPPSVVYAPIDFERETLEQGLLAAGFSTTRPAFFTWLGVVPYLTEEAIFSTLRYIANLPKGTEVVFDYSNPPDLRDANARALHEQRAAGVAALGEKWVSYFGVDDLARRLHDVGFTEIKDLGPKQIAQSFSPERAATASETGGHVVRALCD